MSFYISIKDGDGKLIDNPKSRKWYHGSPLRLEVLAEGSSITRNRDLAIAFSHRPTRVEVSSDGMDQVIKHNGKENGYLYEIDETVSLEDIYTHPKINEISPEDPWEWLTKRPFRLKLIQKTII